MDKEPDRPRRRHPWRRRRHEPKVSISHEAGKNGDAQSAGRSLHQGDEVVGSELQGGAGRQLLQPLLLRRAVEALIIADEAPAFPRTRLR